MGLIDAMGKAAKFVIGGILAVVLGLTGIFMLGSPSGGTPTAIVGVAVIILAVGFWFWAKGA